MRLACLSLYAEGGSGAFWRDYIWHLGICFFGQHRQRDEFLGFISGFPLARWEGFGILGYGMVWLAWRIKFWG